MAVLPYYVNRSLTIPFRMERSIPYIGMKGVSAMHRLIARALNQKGVEMEYKISSGQWEQQGVQTDAVEEFLRPVTPYLQIFTLTAILPITVMAKILKDPSSDREIVRLSDGTKEVDLSRNTSDFPDGDICVSSRSAVVNSINIEFRNYHDELTDRGLVWVFPGSPATMTLLINAQALKTPKTVSEIVLAAEKAVRDKVLSHFQ